MSTAVKWTQNQLKLLEEGKQPRAKRRPPPERNTHIAICDLLEKLARPEWYFCHVPLGEYRTEQTGKLLKRMGVKPGVPDFLLIDADGQHYYLELKRGKSARLTPEQIDFQTMCINRDIPHAVTRSFAEAEAQLRQWGVLRPEAA